MRVVMLTAGSRGDVQPLAAVALELKSLGHEVRLCGSANFRAFVAALGLEFAEVMPDTGITAGTQEIAAQMNATNPLTFALSFRKVQKRFREEFLSLHQRVWESCQDADAIVYHPGMMNGFFISRQLSVPGLLASPIPLFSTAAYPSPVFYAGPRLGRLYNRFTHRVFQAMFWMPLKTSIREFWAGQDAGPESLANPIRRLHAGDAPVLYGLSPSVMPEADDLPGSVRTTGYWFLDHVDWDPPEDLEAFLNAGPAPVSVGMGSLDSDLARRSVATAVRAFRDHGQRVVVIASSPIADQVLAPDPDVFQIRDVPHGWLFPRMAVVVHHGGAGTTAAALRSGVPSIVVPQSNDQPMWARRVEELGVGARVRPQNRTDSHAYSAALAAALLPETLQRANELGDRIRAETGAATAAGIIHEYATRS